MKSVMLFGGYQSQFVGMGKALYDDSRILQEYFEEASTILNINFVKLAFASSETELAKLPNALFSLFLFQSGLCTVLKNQGIMPSAVAGYNLGEYSAMFAAGGFSFPDGLYLLQKYAQFYTEFIEQNSVSMIRIQGILISDLQELCTQAGGEQLTVAVAIYNGQNDHIVGGHTQAIERLRELCTQYFFDAQVAKVPVEVGLHSGLLNEAAQNYALYLEKVDFKDLEIPLISGGGGQLLQSGQHIKQRVVELVNKPIFFNKVIDRLAEYDLIIDIGPGSMVSNLVKLQYSDKMIITLSVPEDIEKLKQLMQPSIETTEI